jgi:ribosome biogenesis GTPase A
MNWIWKIKIELNPEVTNITLTSDTKKAWNPYGTLWGNSTTATGSADMVFASITFTDDFLHVKDKKLVFKKIPWACKPPHPQCPSERIRETENWKRKPGVPWRGI